MNTKKTFSAIYIFMVMFALSVNSLNAEQEPPRKYKPPFSYEIDIGGTTPMGAAASPYSSSFMFGGGASLPLGKWVSLDLLSMDFGFGTTKQTQTILVSDNSRRTTKNYQ